MRPEFYKLVEPGKTQEMLKAKKFDEVQANIKAAEAFPALTPYEQYILNRVKLSLAANNGNKQMESEALEAVIASNRADKKDQLEFIHVLADNNYTAKNYAKAIELYKRYQTESGSADKVRKQLSRAYFLNQDFVNAKPELDKIVADVEAAGKVPDREDLGLQADTAVKLKDFAGYDRAMEKLVKHYPSDQFWTSLLRRLPVSDNFSERLQLDLLRLQFFAMKAMAPTEYVNLAEMDLLAGYFTEAKNVVDAGFANNVLNDKHKALRDRVNKGAADDAKTIASGENSARAHKLGLPMLKLGYAYVTMGQFDKGLDLMEKGIAKGGLKNPEDGKLLLGVAYARAGRKADALKTFDTIKGKDGTGDLARYWSYFLNGPTAMPVTAPVAVAAAPAAEAAAEKPAEAAAAKPAKVVAKKK